MPALMVVEMNMAEFYVKLGAFETGDLEDRTSHRAPMPSVAPLFTEKARSNLIIPFTYSGRAAEAVTLGREGLSTLQQRRINLRSRGAVYAVSPRRSTQPATWASAIEHLEAAAELRRATSFGQAAAQYGALLAAFYAQAGDCASARSHAGSVPTKEPERSVGLLWPQRSAWCAAFAYHACGDEAAAREWLDRAYALYEEHLPHLDAEQREIFAKLPWHRAMLAARAGDWPAEAWRV